MKSNTKKLKIETGSGTVSAILDAPAKPVVGITLAHGAGAGMNHDFLVELTSSLTSQGIAVLRFQFPYMEAGKKRVDRPSFATATIAAAVQELRRRVPRAPLYAAGKSFGARMTTTACAEGLLPDIDGIICYGFPLHHAGEPDVSRAKHLVDVRSPVLFLQGTRDDLADLKLMRKVCRKLRKARLHEVEGADHGFNVLKRSGRTSNEVFEELARESLRFCR